MKFDIKRTKNEYNFGSVCQKASVLRRVIISMFFCKLAWPNGISVHVQIEGFTFRNNFAELILLILM